jgi:nitrogen regulatory protein PII
MEELKAYIREQRLNEVVRALRAAGVTAVTVVKTVPMGAEVDPEYVDVDQRYPSSTSRRC